MKIYIDGVEYNFSLDELDDMYIGEGREGIVYKYNNLALKIYKDRCSKDRLDEEEGKDLIKYMKMSEFYNEVELLEEDVKVLSNNFISIEDLDIYNLVYGDGLYLVDPGSYCFETTNSSYIESNNMANLKSFLIEMLFFCTDTFEYKKIENYFKYCDSFSEMLYKDYNDNENVNQYVKRISSL